MSLPPVASRFRAEDTTKEESDYGEEEIVYIKFDITALYPDDSEELAEAKERNRELREELDTRVENLKQERGRVAQMEDAMMESERALEEKTEEMGKFYSMLRHKEQEFKQWRSKIDQLEHYTRELEVKLARTEASLKIALHKYNESYHHAKVLAAQVDGLSVGEGPRGVGGSDGRTDQPAYEAEAQTGVSGGGERQEAEGGVRKGQLP